MPTLTPQTRSIWIICSMGVLTGLVLLDETVLGVALPSIRNDLSLSQGTTHWVVNAYFLTLTCLAALCGKCVDLFGLRPLLVVGGTLFSFASLLAGFAQSETMLIAMRALQGAGAAMLFALSQAGANMAFPPEKRGLGIGIYAAMATVSLAAGPLIGGVITHYVSWHWIFWLNIPIVAIVGTIAFVVWQPPSETDTQQTIDGLGLVLMLVGLLGCVFAVMEGSSFGWLSPIILGSASVGLLGLIAFHIVERRRAQPLIDVKLFDQPVFSAACLIFMVSQYALITLAVFYPIYLQETMGFSAAKAGLAAILAFIAFPLISAPVGRLADRFGSRRIVSIGCFGASASMITLAILMPYQSYWTMAAPLVIWGASMPFVTGPSRRVAVNAAPDNEQGQLSGTIVTVRLLGSTLGVGISSALITAGFDKPLVIAFSGGLLAAVCLLAVAVLTDDRTEKKTV